MATSPIAGLTPQSGGTSSSTLSDWAGPYVTDMLGKAQAIANQPYAVYGGPQTAGESGLQSKVFQGLGNLSFPSNLGQSFASPMGGGPNTSNSLFAGVGAMPPGGDYGGGAIPPGSESQYGGPGRPGYDTGPDGKIIPFAQTPIGSLQPPQTSQQPSNIAQSYMNPYLQSVLNPQLDELRRQNDITNMNTNAKMTQAGGYGGGRQAIMNAENNRNLMQEMNKTVGQGYANAYDKAMGQFNTEQGQAKTLADMMSEAGTQQRNIEQQGISADYNEFLAQRDDPMKKTQYLQSMLQGLPISTVTNTAPQQTGLGSLVSSIGGMGSIMDSLKKFNLTGG